MPKVAKSSPDPVGDEAYSAHITIDLVTNDDRDDCLRCIYRGMKLLIDAEPDNHLAHFILDGVSEHIPRPQRKIPNNVLQFPTKEKAK